MTYERIETARRGAERPFDNAFLRNISGLAFLSERDRAAIAQVSAPMRSLPAHADLVRRDDVPERALILLEGFACRYRYLSDGRRQILAFLLPGDLVDLDCALLGRMDHAIGASTACKIAWVSHEAYERLLSEHPQIASALRLAKLAEEAISRDWLVGLGRRSAAERLAYLFSEFLDRLQAVSLADENSCDLPITQVELSDAAGLSTVHVSRSLQALRSAGLVQVASRRLQVEDLPRLHAFCEFTPRQKTFIKPPAIEFAAATLGVA